MIKGKGKGNIKRQKAKRAKASVTQRVLGIFLLCLMMLVLGVIIFNFFKGTPPARSNTTATQHIPNTSSTQQAGATTDAGQQATANAVEAQNQRAKYSFYNDLRKRSEEVHVELEEKIKAAEEIKIDGKNYRIQIGAFRERAHADRLRARMILRNYPVQIINNGELFLVQVGPYMDREEALSIQRKLQRQGIKDSVLKAYLN